MLASSKSSSTNILRGHGPVRTAPTNTGTITARGITTNGIKKNPKNSILRNSILHPARMGPLTTDAPVYLRSVRLLAEATPAALRHRNSGITPERVIVPVPTGKMTKKERAAAHIAAQAAADSIIPEVDPSGVTTASIGFKMVRFFFEQIQSCSCWCFVFFLLFNFKLNAHFFLFFFSLFFFFFFFLSFIIFYFF
tara:strand:- start:879 stop:1463 length:585 start_codon:yes stop_codon:yes gene_type:complete